MSRAQLNRWRLSIFAVFTASGLSFATWASRLPAISLALGITNAQIGLLLLGAAAASIVGLSLAPLVLARVGARRGMLLAILTFAVGVLIAGLGADLWHVYGIVLVGLFLFGLGNGCLDVMMNVEGAAIEREVGKTILPLFHAFFSVGTVLGAGLGLVAVSLGVTVSGHTTFVAIVLTLVAFIATSGVPTADAAELIPDEPAAAEAPATQKAPFRERMHVALAAWKEPRTYTLGVIMLGMAFAEGGANDWLPLAVVQGHDASQEVAAAALTVFSISMTIVRALGGPLVDRFGRVMVLRVLALLASGGLLLFILAPSLPVVFVAAVLWGAGASLGFPLGMSAAADDPAKAASRVAAASTIGYFAFLCGPPALGFISEHIGLLNTLYILVVLALASGIAAPAAKPIAGSAVGRGSASS